MSNGKARGRRRTARRRHRQGSRPKQRRDTCSSNGAAASARAWDSRARFITRSQLSWPDARGAVGVARSPQATRQRPGATAPAMHLLDTLAANKLRQAEGTGHGRPQDAKISLPRRADCRRSRRAHLRSDARSSLGFRTAKFRPLHRRLEEAHADDLQLLAPVPRRDHDDRPRARSVDRDHRVECRVAPLPRRRIRARPRLPNRGSAEPSGRSAVTVSCVESAYGDATTKMSSPTWNASTVPYIRDGKRIVRPTRSPSARNRAIRPVACCDR